ncbi:MAG: pyruvate carboxylase subunit B [Dehalococcoidales bacterium]
MKSINHGKLAAGLLDGPVVKVDNPVKIQDITLRDGHQSIYATRGRTEDFIPIAEQIDKVGFYSLEVWGGATFDTMHRFLGEDPWERIRTLKKHITKTPFSMLLRGQNLVGYRNYPDDVAEAFVDRACENGMDIFRVFDALNDFRNFETVVRVIKNKGKHFQGSICYSLTESRMGGTVYNLDYYVNKAKELETMGADTICIKDMAGLIAPYDAYALIKALKEAVKVPIHLHSHFTSGMADMSLLKAIEAGVDIVDTCLSTWAYRTSHPAVEPLVAALKYTNRDTGLDLKILAQLSDYLEKISPKYKHLLDERTSIIDINVLLHQTPGGMLSNLVNQLKEMDHLDKLDEVFKQLPIVRKELGQVPLVTPTSQIVGIQTVNNVLFDTPDNRYTRFTSQVKDLCFGLYGKTAIPIDPEVQKKALKDYPKGNNPITTRPADVLEPEMEKAKKDTEGLAKDIDDILTYAIYPMTGKRFLKWKYGLEDIPDEVKPITLDKVKAQDELVRKAKEGLLAEKAGDKGAKMGPEARTFRVLLNNKTFDVEVEQIGGQPLMLQGTPSVGQRNTLQLGRQGGAVKTALKVVHSKRDMSKEEKAPASIESNEGASETPVQTPMTGSVVRYEVKEGDSVAEGDVVAILEAMKMDNFITSPVTGKVHKILIKEGTAVKKGETLVLIT